MGNGVFLCHGLVSKRPPFPSSVDRQYQFGFIPKEDCYILIQISTSFMAKFCGSERGVSLVVG